MKKQEKVEVPQIQAVSLETIVVPNNKRHAAITPNTRRYINTTKPPSKRQKNQDSEIIVINDSFDDTIVETDYIENPDWVRLGKKENSTRKTKIQPCCIRF